METDAEKVTSFEDNLLTVAEEITQSEMSHLKFLCFESIPYGIIEHMDMTDFLECLKQRGIISADKCDFLIESLILIGRDDLAGKLGYDEKDIQILSSNHQKYESSAGLSSFVILLYVLAKNLKTEEVKKMNEYLRDDTSIPKGKVKTYRDGVDLMSMLVKLRYIQSDELQNLLEMVEKLGLKDLESQITSYQVIHPPSEESIKRRAKRLQEEEKNKDDEDYDFEKSTDVPGLQTAEKKKDDENESTDGFEKKTAVGETLQKYKMSAKPRGICLIFNNINFRIDSLQDRIGSNFDKDELKKVFKSFHFKIIVHEDLTKDEMQEKLDKVSSMDHGEYDCFVCCILSHGETGNVFGVDGKGMPYRMFTLPFQPSKCKSLTGKPKLFFIQACQGSAYQSGEEIETDGATFSSIPNEADFLMAYATVQGYVSFRSKTHGSWYIQNLCKVFRECSEKYDLNDMLLKVNELVSQKDGPIKDEIYKQVPAPSSTLRGKIFFL